MEVSGRRETNKQTTRKDGRDILCQPCHGDGENIPAEGFCETCNEYFCTSCLKFHRKQSVSKNHVIKSKDEMPRVHIPTDPCSELCAAHKTEIVKFYCQQHDSVGCGDCMILRHKSCNIQLISDVSGNYSNSDEIEKIKQEIEYLRKEISSYKDGINCGLKDAEEAKVKVVKEIKTFRRELDSYLDHFENKLIQEIDETIAKDVSKKRKLLDECESTENEMKEFQSKLEQHSDKMNQLFVTAKLAQDNLQKCMKSKKEVASRCNVNVFSFEPSKELMALKVNNTSIGVLTTRTKKLVGQSKRNIDDMEAQFVKKLNVQATNEKHCWITGIAMISCDELLLADRTNKSLKILNVRNNAITSRLRCAAWDVTQISSDTSATTLPDKGIILFVNTTYGLSESRKLKVRKGCRGIDCKNDIIAVSFCATSDIQILNLEGHVLHKVKDTSIFEWPGYISLSNDITCIYVSDADNHAVHVLTLDGHLIDTMKSEKLKFPAGQAVVKDGTVLVCSSEAPNMVHMMVPDTGEIVPLSVQSAEWPRSILLCEFEKLLYVCEDRVATDCNYIKMYDLK